MNTLLRRVGSAVSPVALLVAILALVLSAAGVGYAAGQIGTSGIKNNAITAKKIKKNAVTTKKIKKDAVTADKIKKDAVTADKIKDGSLTAADLAKPEVEHLATFTNGGEGDCVWTSVSTVITGIGPVSYRKDQLGTVHLAGILSGADGPGGDGDCDNGGVGQSSDAIVFMLPAGYIPGKTLIFGGLGATGVVIVGVQGVTIGSLVLPPGAVATGVSGSPSLLDGITFAPAESGVTLPKTTASRRGDGGALLKAIGLS